MCKDFLGGLFDFNGDGKTDPSEQFLAFMMMQEIIEDEERDDLFDYDETDS